MKNKYKYIGAVCVFILLVFFILKINNKCLGVICNSDQTCINGQCVPNTTDIKDQPDSSVQIVNGTSEQPLHIYLESLPSSIDNTPVIWSKNENYGSPGANVDSPVEYGPSNPDHPANDVGAGYWCVVTLNPKEWIILDIPKDMPKYVAWSIRPLKYIGGSDGKQPCNGENGCGMPILIESGKDMVADMSAVDGVNFFAKYQVTSGSNGDITTIDFNTNPCNAVGLNIKGCKNPHVDGIFKNGLNPCLNANYGDDICKVDTDCQGSQKCVDYKCKPNGLQYDPSVGYYCFGNDPCPAGTCNLIDDSLKWCDAIHTGQCANSKSNWTGQGGYSGCADNNQYTTYCYSHDDANSSPNFSSPYKMKIIYTDLN